MLYLCISKRIILHILLQPTDYFTEDRPAGAYEERAEKAWKEGMRTHMRKVLLQTKMLKLEDLEEQQRPLKLIAQQQKRKMV